MDMKKRGYLLVEMMVSLVILMVSSLIIAHIQGQIALWHRQAEQYLMATTIAQEILAYIPHAIPKSYKDDFHIKIDTKSADTSITYTLYTVTISFGTAQGTPKKLVFYKGVINAQK